MNPNEQYEWQPVIINGTSILVPTSVANAIARCAAEIEEQAQRIADGKVHHDSLVVIIESQAAEIEAMRDCVKELRLYMDDAAIWHHAKNALARLDAIRGESQ